MPTNLSNNIGLYLVNGIAGNQGTPGAATLQFSLLVNAGNGKITGHASQTQALKAPYDKIAISDIKGTLRVTTTGPLNQLVHLTGQALISFPPPAIGSYLAPFEADFSVDSKWQGSGGWTLAGVVVNDVPVKEQS